MKEISQIGEVTITNDEGAFNLYCSACSQMFINWAYIDQGRAYEQAKMHVNTEEHQDKLVQQSEQLTHPI